MGIAHRAEGIGYWVFRTLRHALCFLRREFRALPYAHCTLPFAEIRRPEGEQQKITDEKGIEDVNRQVDDMIPGHLKPTELVVHGKGKIADIPPGIIGNVLFLRRYERINALNEGIALDLINIIKGKGDIKTVCVSDKSGKGDEDNIGCSPSHGLKIIKWTFITSQTESRS